MVKNNRIVSEPIHAIKGTVIHLLSSKYYYDIGNGWTQEDMVIDADREITIRVCKDPINSKDPSMAFSSVDEIEDIVSCLISAKITDDYLRFFYKIMNKVKGDRFKTGGGMVKNNRIVSEPIHAIKGTVIHLLSPTKYYYDIGNGWTQEDMVIDADREITILVCKDPINSTDPSMAFSSVDEIEDIVSCLIPANAPRIPDEVITLLYKNMNKVKGDHFSTGGDGMVKNNRIVSEPIYALKGTVIHLLSSKYYYDIGDGFTQEDKVIDADREITIRVCKDPINSTDPSMAFSSVDEIEDIVLCIVPENKYKENKELVRQATYSSDNNYGETISTPVFSLLHFSDLHGDVSALKRIVKKGSEYPVDDMICTGDMVEDNSSESIKNWWEPTVLTCMGNHDVAVRTDYDGTISYDWNNLATQERNNAYISPFISQWGSVTHESGTSYYFKDYPNKKVRLVVVDIMLYLQKNGNTSHETESANQTQWLEETLQSAINLNYHVVIATHFPLLGARIKECSFSPYDSDDTPFSGDAFTTILQDTVDKYVQKGECKIVCVNRYCMNLLYAPYWGKQR